LSREEYLGLYLTVGLLSSLLMLGLFIGIARSVEGEKRLTHFDREVNEYFAEHRESSPDVRQLFVVITQFGSVRVLAALAVVVAIFLLMMRRRLLALVWLVAPAGGALLDAVLKLAFERQRPPLRDPAIHEMTMSFPSGHAMGSLIGYGLLAYLLVLLLRHTWLRIPAVTLLGLLIAAIGFSRVYLGAHYPSDVLAGYAAGGCWLAACVSALEMIRRRHGHASAQN
jgi:undecaprenyl-diphosphatase